MADTLRDLVVKLGFDVDTTKIPQLDRQLQGATQKATGLDKALGSAFARIAGPAAVAGLGFKGVGMVKDALVESSDAAVTFGRNMAAIQTIIPNSPGRVAELADEIQRLSIATGKTSAEVSAAVNDVLQAFDDTADTMKLAEIATRGATASGTDARTAFDLLSSAMLQYGTRGAEAAKHTMDMAFAMRQFGKVEIAQFAHGMQEVASSAHQLGVSQEEVFGILGATAGVTGPVDQSFTQLNGVITALVTPTKDLAKMYKDLGITSVESEIKQNGLFNTLKKLYDQTDGTSTALAKLIPDARASRMAWPLVTQQADRYAEAMDRVAHSAGAAAEADKAYRGGLNKTGTALDQIEAKIAAREVSIGKHLDGMAIAWGNLKLAAIGTMDAIAARIEKENSQVEEGDSPILRAQKKTNLGKTALAEGLGGGLALVVSKLSGDEKGAAAIRDALRRRGDELRDAGSPERRGLKWAEQQVHADNAQLRATRETATTIVQNNTISLTVPEGADPTEYADAVGKGMYDVMHGLARNVRAANSGENP